MRERRENASQNSGFTLIEMIVALVILSAATAMVTVVMAMAKNVHDIGFENIAFHIAENKMNELRAGGYATLPSSGTFTDPQLSIIPQGQASTTVSVWNAKTKQVLVGVSWVGTIGAQYTSLTTLVTQSGGL